MQVAGALKYTQDDFFKRLMLQMISKSSGGSTDTSKDHEYTDWTALARFVSDFTQ
jgi:menaquinone-dependent protoporphyrinogen oxidase